MTKKITITVLILQVMFIALPFIFMHFGYDKAVAQSGLHWIPILMAFAMIPTLIALVRSIKMSKRNESKRGISFFPIIFVIFVLLMSFKTLFDFIGMI